MNVKPLWKYIRERERIRLAKSTGAPPPWTGDEILQRYSFTNVRRCHDRTTVAFCRTYVEHSSEKRDVALYNCGVRRFFGTIEFGEAVGWLEKHNAAALRSAEKRCSHPWTGAYMIRAGRAGEPKVESVIEYLSSLWSRAFDIVVAIDNTHTWKAGYDVMRSCYGFGPFMAKEVLQDYLLWKGKAAMRLEDYETWTPVGPGGLRGLNRLAKRELKAPLSEERAAEEVREALSKIQPLWLAHFPNAGRLTAHDVQFCLCEFDKYERTRLGEGRPRSTYPGRG